MKRYPIFSLAFFLFISAFFSTYGGVTVLPNGVLQNGETATVTGDYVRIRTGPTLHYRILTKVNKGTVATILERSASVVEINGMKNYWYRIKLENKDIEGWMFGAYLKKKEVKIEITATEPVKKPEPKVKNKIDLIPLGVIQENDSLITTGDLNTNGITEIIFVNREEKGRYSNLIGYEKQGGAYNEVYRTKIMGAVVDTVQVFGLDNHEFPLLSVSGGGFTNLYSYHNDRNTLSLLYKLPTPLLAIGNLNGKQSYLISLRKNGVLDNDGTQTYFINVSRLEINRGRIFLKDKIEYVKPFPIKKLEAFDLDNDGSDEIICEIGGGNFGGGIIILKLSGDKITKVLNSGINTYKDSQFMGMWGAHVGSSAKLILYTSDPSAKDDVNTEFGFLIASYDGTHITQEQFYPLNPMLDDTNNTRKVLPYNDENTHLPLVVLDYNRDEKKYILKTPSL
jgi:hypothetical protein